MWSGHLLSGTVVWFYSRYGRLGSKTASCDSAQTAKPFPVMVAEASSHCDSGCTLDDICAEGLALAGAWLGWGSIFAQRTFAVWILDYIFACGFGIIFQYYTIAPMRHLGVAKGTWARDKGRHAFPHRVAGRHVRLHGRRPFLDISSPARLQLRADTPELWSTMQVAMIFGFLTSYPVNWRLLRTGLKERM